MYTYVNFTLLYLFYNYTCLEYIISMSHRICTTHSVCTGILLYRYIQYLHTTLFLWLHCRVYSSIRKYVIPFSHKNQCKFLSVSILSDIILSMFKIPPGFRYHKYRKYLVCWLSCGLT